MGYCPCSAVSIQLRFDNAVLNIPCEYWRHSRPADNYEPPPATYDEKQAHFHNLLICYGAAVATRHICERFPVHFVSLNINRYSYQVRTWTKASLWISDLRNESSWPSSWFRKAWWSGGPLDGPPFMGGPFMVAKFNGFWGLESSKQLPVRGFWVVGSKRSRRMEVQNASSCAADTGASDPFNLKECESRSIRLFFVKLKESAGCLRAQSNRVAWWECLQSFWAGYLPIYLGQSWSTKLSRLAHFRSREISPPAFYQNYRHAWNKLSRVLSLSAFINTLIQSWDEIVYWSGHHYRHVHEHFHFDNHPAIVNPSLSACFSNRYSI